MAPFPEENVERVVAEVGIEPIVFGSDFPHAEGLAFPGEYVAAQLGGIRRAPGRAIMRDNLARIPRDRRESDQSGNGFPSTRARGRDLHAALRRLASGTPDARAVARGVEPVRVGEAGIAVRDDDSQRCRRLACVRRARSPGSGRLA